MRRGRRSSRLAVALSLLLMTVALVAGCTAAPPLPLVRPATPTTTKGPRSQPPPTEVVVGVDKLEKGFNPHKLSDLSPTTTALANVMLPSVFHPSDDGGMRLDTTLMESAEVVPGRPKFTVRYRIRKDASWSDGAPIAAEDFVYLWQELRSQPGIADPAGYRLIDDVASRQGGKTVEVTFAQPYPGWQHLFTNLLPAHLLKDAPGGWATALDAGYPASGGPFAITQVDMQRGEIVLQRNDRYWGPPAASDRIVLRANSPVGQVDALRSGDSHLAVFNADGPTMARLRDLGNTVRLTTVPSTATVQLLLRPSSSQMADVRVRRAVSSALDRQALTDAGTGGGPALQLQDHSEVLGPSEPGYRPSEPAGAVPEHANPGDMARLLTEAGYEFSGGTWVKNGRPLSLVIAAPFGRKDYVAVADSAVKQLNAVGLQAKLITPTDEDLFDHILPTNPVSSEPEETTSVDMAVVPRPAGGDPASMLASSYGCPDTDRDSDKALPFNPAGFCDQLLQPQIEAALSGRIPFTEAQSTVESALWSDTIAIPLYQQAEVMAVGRAVTGVEDGPGLAGPFSSAASWVGTPAKNSNPGY